MSKQNFNIEEFFQHAFEKHTVHPSKQVWLNLKRKLWLKDFFSFKLMQFNVYYVLMLAGGITTAFFIGQDPSGADKKGLLTPVQEYMEPISSAIKSKEKTKLPEKENQSPESEAENKEVYMPEADFSPSVIRGCAPLTVEFENRSRHAETYTWNLGDGTTTLKASPVHVYTTPGTYTARLHVQAGNALEDEKIKKITVLERPVARFKVDASQSSNKRRTIKFVNKSENARNYLWIFGDGESSHDPEPVHTYEVYQTYMVKLIASAANGCSDTTKVLTTFLKEQYGLSFPRNFAPNPLGPVNEGYYKKLDGPGSIFHPHYNGVMNYKLTIKSPDGNNIFDTRQVEQGWNGYVKGRLAPQGKYLWRAEGDFVNGEAFSMTGYVTLEHGSE